MINLKQTKWLVLLIFSLLTINIRPCFAQDDDDEINPGSITFSVNGKPYTTQKITGNLLIGADKKALFNMHVEQPEGNRVLELLFDFKNYGEAKPGKVVNVDPVDGGKASNRAIFMNNPPGDGTETPPSENIITEKETGTFSFSSITVNKGNWVTVSGSFEFKGKNSVEESPVKQVVIKATMKNVRLRYVSPETFGH